MSAVCASVRNLVLRPPAQPRNRHPRPAGRSTTTRCVRAGSPHLSPRSEWNLGAARRVKGLPWSQSHARELVGLCNAGGGDLGRQRRRPPRGLGALHLAFGTSEPLLAHMAWQWTAKAREPVRCSYLPIDSPWALRATA